MNKNVITLLLGIIALIAGALTAAYFIKKKLDQQEEDEETFEDFDLIGDDDDFFGEDEYEEYDSLNLGSDEIPYTEHKADEDSDGENTL